MASGPEQPARVGRVHILLPDMHAVRAGSERHIHPVVDDEGHAERRERRLDGARLRDHLAGLAALVAQLQQRRPAFGDAAREVRQAVAARVFRIDNGIEAQIDAHPKLPPPA